MRSDFTDVLMLRVTLIADTLDEFDSEIKQGVFGLMAQLWQSYLVMIQILLDFIKANGLTYSLFGFMLMIAPATLDILRPT